MTREIIIHNDEGISILQESKRGYINASAMCKAYNKRLDHYWENDGIKEYATEIAKIENLNIKDLIWIIKGGDSRLQGTWVHPDIATHLTQWISPKLAARLNNKIRKWVENSSQNWHARRKAVNDQQIPIYHFSILQQINTLLLDPLETMGYVLPKDTLLDGSIGTRFSQYLVEIANEECLKNIHSYKYKFTDHRRFFEVDAKCYHVDLLPVFIRFFYEVYVPKYLMKYFTDRDLPIEALTKLLQKVNPKKITS